MIMSDSEAKASLLKAIINAGESGLSLAEITSFCGSRKKINVTLTWRQQTLRYFEMRKLVKVSKGETPKRGRAATIYKAV